MSGPLLSVEGLTAGHGDIVVIRELSLTAGAGEVVVVLGPNGAGKTTLLSTIAGLLPARAGHVRFDGAAVDGHPTWKRARLGLCLVQDNKRVFRRQSVNDNLLTSAMGAGREEVEDRRRQVVDLFPVLGTKGGSIAGSLSGGEQQMLAIGQALMGRPRMLLLDEPSAGLAPMLVREMMNKLATVAQAGIGVLLVEQAVSEALRVASRVYLLSGGRAQQRDLSSEAERRTLQDLYLAAASVGGSARLESRS